MFFSRDFSFLCMTLNFIQVVQGNIVAFAVFALCELFFLQIRKLNLRKEMCEIY